MSPEPRELLAETGLRVLEECAFLFVDRASDSENIDADALGAKISIASDSVRQLSVFAPRSVVAEAAANMMGMDCDDPEVVGRESEALCELLNVIAGRFIGTWAGDRTCTIGIPELATGSESSGVGVVVTFTASGGEIVRFEFA